MALLSTGIDWYAQLSSVREIPDYRLPRVLKSLAWGVDLMFIFFAMGAAFQGLHYHHREAIQPLWWGLLIVLLPYGEGSAASQSTFMVMFGPLAIGTQLFFLAFLVALALSIFYRGAVDPRLAARRVTVFGLMSLIVAVLFVVLERALAMKVVAWFQLPQETGALIAAAAVAGTVGPMRATVHRSLNGWVSRFLPLDTLMQGERRTLAVVISDISGYTALSARDEKQAMLLAALLQRQAHRAAEDHGGRVVKSMGDAVVLAFESAGSAARAMQALHRPFGPAAALLGLEPLPMHSGAHYGEVTQTHDGDLYGPTINIAARLLSVAAPGQVVVSAELAAATALDATRVRDLGAKRLKNVPEPVRCVELLEAPGP